VSQVTLDSQDVKVMLAVSDHPATLVPLGLKARLEHQALKDQLVRKVQQALKVPLVPSVHAVIRVMSDVQVTPAALEIRETVDRMANLDSEDRMAYPAQLDSKDAEGQLEQLVALERLAIQDQQDLSVYRDWLAIRVLKACPVRLVLPEQPDQKVSRVLKVHRDSRAAKVSQERLVLQEIPVRTLHYISVYVNEKLSYGVR